MRSSFFALILSLAACSRAEAPLPPPPDPEAAERIAAMERSLREAGIPVSGSEQLRDLREFPGCPEAGLRYRIHLGEPNRFVNVSRFATPEEARACLEDFKATALKAGPSGWERLGPTISTHGRWLFLFPQDLRDGAFRRRVVEALLEAE